MAFNHGFNLIKFRGTMHFFTAFLPFKIILIGLMNALQLNFKITDSEKVTSDTQPSLAFHCLTGLMGFHSSTCHVIKFVQLWKADAFWEDNKAFKKHSPDQPDGKCFN